MTTANSNETPKKRNLHFDLSHLGPAHESGSYTLRTRGQSYPMRRHTGETLQAMGAAAGGRTPTHFAEAVATEAGEEGPVQGFGPPPPHGCATAPAGGT